MGLGGEVHHRVDARPRARRPAPRSRMSPSTKRSRGSSQTGREVREVAGVGELVEHDDGRPARTRPTRRAEHGAHVVRADEAGAAGDEESHGPARLTGHARNHPGRRHRHATPPDHHGHQQAAGAGLRQADDLLPADHADAGGHPRHPGDHDAARRGRSSSGCSATGRSTASTSPTPQQPTPDGLAQAFTIGADFIGGRDQSRWCSATTCSTGPGFGRQARAVPGRRRRRGVRLLGGRPHGVRRRGVRRRPARRCRWRRSRPSRAAATRSRGSTSTTTTSSRSPADLKPSAPGRVRDHRRQPGLPRRRAGSASRCSSAASRGWTPAPSTRSTTPATSSRPSSTGRASRSAAPRRSPGGEGFLDRRRAPPARRGAREVRLRRLPAAAARDPLTVPVGAQA